MKFYNFCSISVLEFQLNFVWTGYKPFIIWKSQEIIIFYSFHRLYLSHRLYIYICHIDCTYICHIGWTYICQIDCTYIYSNLDLMKYGNFTFTSLKIVILYQYIFFNVVCDIQQTFAQILSINHISKSLLSPKYDIL